MNREKTSGVSAFFGSTRTSRAIAVGAALTLLALVLSVLCNLLVGLLPETVANPDVTGKQTFLISGTTKDFLKTLDTDVTLTLVCEGGEANADGDLYAFLSRYADASDCITLQVVDSSDQAFLAERDAEEVTDLSIIVESDLRTRVIDSIDLFYYRYYESSYGEILMTPEEYTAMLQSLSEYAAEDGGESLLQFMQAVTPYFEGESRVTNAIGFVTLDDVAVAYTLTGNGATALDGSFKDLLMQSAYEVRETRTLSALPRDCDLLIVNALSTDLNDASAKALSEYLADGGKLLLTTLSSVSAEELPNLAAVLGEYGMGFDGDLHYLCDANPNYYLSGSSSSYPYIFMSHIASTHAFTGDFDGKFAAVYPHAIVSTPTDGVTLTPWLYTSEAGYKLGSDGAQIGDKAAYTFGMIAEKDQTQIVWIACPTALTTQADDLTSGGNFDLVLQALHAMTGVSADAIDIDPRVLETASLSVTGSQFAILAFFLVILIPTAAFTTGAVVHYVRKKK